MKEINLLELFSGTGGFTKGFLDAGYTIKNHYFSEIDKHAIANYKYNFKKSIYYGSVTNVQGKRGEANIITFGSPCQDFSLGGKRAGMEGQRSSLILEAIRLIGEIRPSVFIWENVKGTFSSNNGEDFWAIIAAFANIGGYRLEWQLLNTSWFLPQNRERIYLIGHFDGRSKPGVFPIGEDNRINNERQKVGKIYESTRTLTTRYAQDDSTGSFIQVKFKNKNLNKTIEKNNLKKVEIKALDLYNQKAKDISPTLTEPHHNDLRLFDGYAIRRLTEIECERLQGFPDNWTKYGIYDGEVKEVPKTQRYKMMGNAVTVKVVEEIAKKLKINK